MPGVDADQQLVAVLQQGHDDGREESPNVLGGVHVAGPEHDADDGAGVGDGHERMVALQPVVPFVGRTFLSAVRLVGDRVHVQDDATTTPTLATHALPSKREQPLRQLPAVVRAAQHRRQARLGRLRGQAVRLEGVLGGPQRAITASLRHCDAEGRVVTQRIGVVLVSPALGHQQHAGQHEFVEWVRDAVLSAVVHQRGHHRPQPQAVRDLTQEQRQRPPSGASSTPPP